MASDCESLPEINVTSCFSDSCTTDTEPLDADGKPVGEQLGGQSPGGARIPGKKNFF